MFCLAYALLCFAVRLPCLCFVQFSGFGESNFGVCPPHTQRQDDKVVKTWILPKAGDIKEALLKVGRWVLEDTRKRTREDEEMEELEDYEDLEDFDDEPNVADLSIN